MSGSYSLNIDYLFYQIYLLIIYILGFDTNGTITDFYPVLNLIWRIELIITVLFFFGAVFFIWKIGQIRKEENAAIFTADGEALLPEMAEEKNKDWEEVRAHLRSNNPANWKLAVIEADKMLNEALNKLGYLGVSVGDKLKTIPPGLLASIEDAWLAHKVRNQIAHEQNFELTQYEAEQAINHYERVFKEIDLL